MKKKDRLLIGQVEDVARERRKLLFRLGGVYESYERACGMANMSEADKAKIAEWFGVTLEQVENSPAAELFREMRARAEAQNQEMVESIRKWVQQLELERSGK